MRNTTVGQRKIATSRPPAASGENDRLSQHAGILEAVCAMAFRDGKTGGCYNVRPDYVVGRLRIPREIVDDVMITGVRYGWLREVEGEIRLAAGGIYIAKLTLDLPT